MGWAQSFVPEVDMPFQDFILLSEHQKREDQILALGCGDFEDGL